jgi:ABC-type uncharacterized transport system ATPase subunit
METAALVSPALMEQLRALPGVREATQQDGVLRVTMSGEQQVTGRVVTLVTQETALRTITQREPDLNEVFLSLTGSALRD